MKRHLIWPNNPDPRHMMLMTIISAYPAINSIPDTNQLIPDNGALQTPRIGWASVSPIGSIRWECASPQKTSVHQVKQCISQWAASSDPLRSRTIVWSELPLLKQSTQLSATLQPSSCCDDAPFWHKIGRQYHVIQLTCQWAASSGPL